MKDLEKTILLKNERKALLEASTLLKKNYPIQQIILFGSKARGDSDQFSDIDILLITSCTLDWKDEKKAVEQLFDIGIKNDVIFSPLFASSEEWETEVFREFPIYKEIEKEGALVA